jgi:4a-hydroxytetrahydrobiopterin dehydratase
MTVRADDLAARHCRACEGGLPALTPEEVREHLRALPEWELAPDTRRIRRSWRVRDFLAGLEFFRKIAEVAEAEDHHPDLHLVSYRNVTVELWTHTLGGLSENDFILAARIDRLPVELKA